MCEELRDGQLAGEQSVVLVLCEASGEARDGHRRLRKPERQVAWKRGGRHERRSDESSACCVRQLGVVNTQVAADGTGHLPVHVQDVVPMENWRCELCIRVGIAGV